MWNIIVVGCLCLQPCKTTPSFNMHLNLWTMYNHLYLFDLPVSKAFLLQIPAVIHPVKQNLMLLRLNKGNLKLIGIHSNIEMTFCIRIVVISSDKFNISVKRWFKLGKNVIRSVDHCFIDYNCFLCLACWTSSFTGISTKYCSLFTGIMLTRLQRGYTKSHWHDFFLLYVLKKKKKLTGQL